MKVVWLCVVAFAVAVLVLGIGGAAFAVARRKEAFAAVPEAPVDGNTPGYTDFKLCASQSVCASQSGIDPAKCLVPEVGGTACCRYNAASKTCESKYSNPITSIWNA